MIKRHFLREINCIIELSKANLTSKHSQTKWNFAIPFSKIFYLMQKTQRHKEVKNKRTKFLIKYENIVILTICYSWMKTFYFGSKRIENAFLWPKRPLCSYWQFWRSFYDFMKVLGQNTIWKTFGGWNGIWVENVIQKCFGSRM